MFFKKKEKQIAKKVKPIPVLDWRPLREDSERTRGENWETRERNRDLARQLHTAQY